MNHSFPHLVAANADNTNTGARKHGTSLSRRLAAEGIGTCLLLAMVIGSAIMAEHLAGGNAALALLANASASSAGLLALLLAFGSTSAHFNPAVTLSLAWRRKFAWADVAPYVTAQIAGACGGTALAHAMFGLPLFSLAVQAHAGSPLWLGEFAATFGLITVSIGCSRSRPDLVPFAVAAYIASGYWFTSSSAFANPALTLARTLSNTVAGIRITDASAYLTAEFAGAAAATALFGWLLRDGGR